jgi:hypothetical protein
VQHEYAGRRWRAPAEINQHDAAIVERRIMLSQPKSAISMGNGAMA